MLTGENLPEAESFMRLNRDEFYKGSEISADELARIDEFLPCISELGISGGMLRAGGVVVGLTAGEIVGDTLHVHIEKRSVIFRRISNACHVLCGKHETSRSKLYQPAGRYR